MLNPKETSALFDEIETRRQKRLSNARSIVASPQVLEDYAFKPLLSKAEAVAILQGFTPPVGEYGDEQICYLEDNAEAVQRLLNDYEWGRLPMPCRPQEFVTWSSTAGVKLPDPFVRAVNNGAVGGREGQDSAKQSDGSASAAGRASANLDSQGYDPTLQKRANAIAEMFRKEKGVWPNKRKVVKALASEIGRTPENLVRRIRKEWDPRPLRSLKRVQAALGRRSQKKT